MLLFIGLTHIITMDLHQKEIQGFFDVPVDNLRASPFLLQYIQEQIPDYRNAVIVARNPGSANKATSYAERLRLGINICIYLMYKWKVISGGEGSSGKVFEGVRPRKLDRLC